MNAEFTAAVTPNMYTKTLALSPMSSTVFSVPLVLALIALLGATCFAPTTAMLSTMARDDIGGLQNLLSTGFDDDDSPNPTFTLDNIDINGMAPDDLRSCLQQLRCM